MAVDCVLSGAGHDCGHEWGRLLSLEEETGDVSFGKQAEAMCSGSSRS